jgi:phage terminase small subunit
MPMEYQKLTKKEKAFCEEYIQNGYNATQAYYTAYDCSFDTARAAGCRVARKPHIKAYITELQKQAFAAACITAERVALKLSDIAFADKKDEYYNVTAQLKALDLLQKQLGLQKQKLEADINNDINIVIEE